MSISNGGYGVGKLEVGKEIQTITIPFADRTGIRKDMEFQAYFKFTGLGWRDDGIYDITNVRLTFDVTGWEPKAKPIMIIPAKKPWWRFW